MTAYPHDALCINGCGCHVFSMPPRTQKDYEALNMHRHEGCILWHDGKVCPLPKSQPGLFDKED